MSQGEIAAICKTADDIYRTKFDMRFKLGILLAFEPMSYLNFIRNAEQKEYSLGAHNSKIDNDFNPDNSDWIARVPAWCFDAMSQLKVLRTTYKNELFL